MKNLGQLLKNARENKDYTQKEVMLHCHILLEFKPHAEQPLHPPLPRFLLACTVLRNLDISYMYYHNI